MVLLATAMIVRSGAAGAEADSWAAREQARLAVDAGVRAVAAELMTQRRDLFAGDDPELTPEWTLAEDRGFEWVVRLVGDPRSQTSLRPDLSENGPRGLTRSPAEPDGSEGRGGLPEPGAGSAGDARAPVARVPGLVDAPVQAGIGSGEALAFRGRRRIDLSAGWSSEVFERVRDRFDRDLAESLRSAVERERFSDRGSLRRWIVSGFRGSDASRRGLLDALVWPGGGEVEAFDVVRADADTLGAVLGIDGEAAVSARSGLSEDELASPLWLVETGLLTPSEFAALSFEPTCRSLRWRVIVEAGRRASGTARTSDEFGVLEIDDTYEFPMRYAAVVDISGENAVVIRLSPFSDSESSR